MSRFQLCKVMPFFAPRFGGAVSVARLVCAELAKRGHRVRVVTTDNGVDDSIARGRWTEHDGYEVWYAPTRPWHRVVPYWTPTMRPALEEALADADVCCLNVGLTLSNHLASAVARRRGVPYVYNAEGALCPTRLAIKALRKRIFLRRFERPLLASAAGCQALTRKDALDLEAQGVEPEHIEIIPNGVDAFVPGDGERFRSRYGISPDERVVLFLGRLHEIKGLDLLVDAFALAAPHTTRLVIAGNDEDGTGRRMLAHVAAKGLDNRVVFTGHLDTGSANDALTAADLFVLFSRTEGLPVAVLEALSAGVPCLLTEQCNVPEVEEADAGRVLPYELQPLANALADLLSNADRLRRIGKNARTLAHEKFGLDKVMDRLEAWYAGVASAKHPIP